MKRSMAFLRDGSEGPTMTPSRVTSELTVMALRQRFSHAPE
jgi:hypothetical protein